MRTYPVAIYLAICLLMAVSCKKTKDVYPEKPLESRSESFSVETAPLPHSNENLLNLVLTGSGGKVAVDTNTSHGSSAAAETLTLIEFPAYSPPVNVNGMLQFPSMGDYNSFSVAADLMEEWWIYPDTDYEDTPYEIYHLGDESLNAYDSAMGFSSLRHRYELNEFYDPDWVDTTLLYVDDDDYQIVFNTEQELKIGDKYYKYISDNLIAVVSNSDLQALEMARDYGVFSNHPNISIFNEESSGYVNPPKIELHEQPEGCADFDLYAYANNLTAPGSTVNQWLVELNFAGYFSPNSFSPTTVATVRANFTINWGDGTTETFEDLFFKPAKKRHTYSQVLTAGTSVQKQITVTAQMINPDQAVLFQCPSITSITFTQNANVTLYAPAPQNCLWGTHKRKFEGLQQSVDGKLYRLFCKITQKSAPLLGSPHVKVKAIFEKRKNNGKWKNTNPLKAVTLNLRGDIYKANSGVCNAFDPANGCSQLFKYLNMTKTGKKKKTKIKTPDFSLPCFISNKVFPYAINADFVWTYKRQGAVGNYDEILKP